MGALGGLSEFVLKTFGRGVREGGWMTGEGGGSVYVNEQRFQIALLLFKENNCAKLF